MITVAFHETEMPIQHTGTIEIDAADISVVSFSKDRPCMIYATGENGSKDFMAPHATEKNLSKGLLKTGRFIKLKVSPPGPDGENMVLINIDDIQQIQIFPPGSAWAIMKNGGDVNDLDLSIKTPRKNLFARFKKAGFKVAQVNKATDIDDCYLLLDRNPDEWFRDIRTDDWTLNLQKEAEQRLGSLFSDHSSNSLASVAKKGQFAYTMPWAQAEIKAADEEEEENNSEDLAPEFIEEAEPDSKGLQINLQGVYFAGKTCPKPPRTSPCSSKNCGLKIDEIQSQPDDTPKRLLE